MERLLKESDIKPLLKWARGNTKELIMAGINGKVREFIKLLSEYNFSATLDSNMAAIIIAFYAICIYQYGYEHKAFRGLKKFGVTALKKGSNSYKLFEYLKAGNGKKVKDCMGDYFKKTMFSLLRFGYDSYYIKKDEQEWKKIVEAFIKQAGKITPWGINEQEKISDVIDIFLGTASVKTEKFMERERKYLIKKIVARDSDYFTKPSIRDNFEQNPDKPTISKIWLPSFYKIFPKGKPLPREVKQAGIGDCVLMSQLIALAKTNPKAITDCFVQGLDKIENEDKIDIRFFRVDTLRTEHHMKPIIITVKRNSVIGAYEIKDHALWPKLIEKAYAVYAKEGFANYYSKSLSIEGGQATQHVTFAITGNISTSVDPGFGKGKPENVIDTIKRKLNKSRVLTCGFKAKFKIRDVKNNEEIEIHDMHSYAIVGINEDKKYIRLIEPNKAWGRKYSTKLINTDWPEPAQEGGHIAMSFNDFKNNFSTLSYSTSKKSNSYKVSDFD